MFEGLCYVACVHAGRPVGWWCQLCCAVPTSGFGGSRGDGRVYAASPTHRNLMAKVKSMLAPGDSDDAQQSSKRGRRRKRRERRRARPDSDRHRQSQQHALAGRTPRYDSKHHGFSYVCDGSCVRMFQFHPAHRPRFLVLYRPSETVWLEHPVSFLLPYPSRQSGCWMACCPVVFILTRWRVFACVRVCLCVCV